MHVTLWVVGQKPDGRLDSPAACLSSLQCASRWKGFADANASLFAQIIIGACCLHLQSGLADRAIDFEIV